ncbi:chromate transporter-domain-containing protein [Pyronema omphalodes]|nr:chromate transporter-domain-containing protein [Pyronema omphalodes]
MSSAIVNAATETKLYARFRDVFLRTWDLGFTAFGGPPVHFQILHRRFVDGMGKAPWIDEQTYQELFAVCGALPGPGSTKMAFCIALIHAGFLPAMFVFMMWSLPGAIGMFGLALGIQRVSDILPDPVYALLSGLNAATVGIIALAAVQLAKKAITDKITRAVVLLGGGAGLCYSALWYFPVLMVIGGITTLVWDSWIQQRIVAIRKRFEKREEQKPQQPVVEEVTADEAAVPVDQKPAAEENAAVRRSTASRTNAPVEATPEPAAPALPHHYIPIKVGIFVIIGFFISFIAIMVIRGVVKNAPLQFSVFANMYLAGTVIFGGGPVVIPLLREYVVEPGWVSPRDFLLGLALIQAFPGPNFNFAVYLGGLALAKGGAAQTVLGSFLGFLGIFFPGITLAVGFQSIWIVARKKMWVKSLLRGVNAAAVGLVFTAVYRLWEIGYLTPQESRGMSLAKEPWWLVVSATTFTVVEWYAVPPAGAILAGGVAGLAWWGAIKA